jgi:transaldolase
MSTAPVGHAAIFHRRALLPVVNADRDTGLAGDRRTIRHPAPRAPRFFADSATRADVEPLLRAGIISGLTTNPTLLKRAGADSWTGAKTLMRELCALFAPHPVSLELTALDEESMVAQAAELAALGDNAVIKVPIGGYRAVSKDADPHTGLRVIRRLWERGIQVNTTLVFSTTQAMWAANAGATYVSPFLGRLSVYGHEDLGTHLIHEIAAVFANYRVATQILASSLRTPAQLTECLLAGADVLTVPAPLLAGVADHPLSDEGLRTFAKDAESFAR